MHDKPSKIIGEIETYRGQLDANLSDLESRVSQATNWRTYYDRHPYMFVGAALGGGLLLAGFASRGSNGHMNGDVRRLDGDRGPASEIIDSVKAALVIYGTAKAKDMLGQILPGFH